MKDLTQRELELCQAVVKANHKLGILDKLDDHLSELEDVASGYMACRIMGFKIGGYTLFHFQDGYWITGEGGEGQQVNKENFEKLIHGFYKENM